MADNWTVTSQRQTTQITSGGRFQDVMEIHFVTTQGVEGSVRVPLGQYNPDTVHRLISSYVENIDAIHNL